MVGYGAVWCIGVLVYLYLSCGGGIYEAVWCSGVLVFLCSGVLVVWCTRVVVVGYMEQSWIEIKMA